MIFPTPISLWPFLIAIIEVINSGSEVPIAITVKPIIFSDNPNSLPVFLATITNNQRGTLIDLPEDYLNDDFIFQVSGNTLLSGNVSVKQDMLITGNLTVTGQSTFTSMMGNSLHLQNDGLLTVNSLWVSDLITANSSLVSLLNPDIAQSVTIDEYLKVDSGKHRTE